MPPSLEREDSLARKPVINPFKFEVKLPWYRKLQMAIMSVTIAPLRLILMVLCLCIAWIFASIVLAGISKEELATVPITGWRKNLRRKSQLMCQAAYWVFGFSWKIIGEQADQTEASVFIFAPHSTLIDAGAIILLNCVPYAVTREENNKIPLIGKLMKLAQPVYVYREDRDSRQKTIAELKRRAQTGGLWPQFLIFPEGTTTNRKALITFKAGAFIPGMPVQPVVLRYPDEWDSVTWTWEGPGAPLLLWMCLCKLWTTLEVEFLPVYTPNEEEKKDPYLYAENVRNVMARALDIPTTDHTFEDCRLMLYAKKTNLKMGDALIEFRKMQRRLGLDFDTVHKLLDRFSAMSELNDNGGQVDIETFAKYLRLPITDTLQQLFNMYDTDGSGHIDFREYVIGMSMISEPAGSDETVQLAFKLFDKDNKGYVTREEFTELLTDTLDAQESEAKSLFDKVDSSQSGKLTFADFKSYAGKMPEYASLFTTYHKLKESGSSGGGLFTDPLDEESPSPNNGDDVTSESEDKKTK